MTRHYAPLSRIQYDEHGIAASMAFYVLPCSAEPRETFDRIAEARARGAYEPWTHGLAVMVVPNGCDEPLALCGACGEAWNAETARQARMRRLPPPARSWLASHGVADPATLQAPLGPAPDVRVGDMVAWHPEAEMNVEWMVVAAHGNGRVNIEAEIPEHGGVRKVVRTVRTRDCRVTVRPMSMDLE